VILKLVEQGKLGLDDPVSRFVPGVPNGVAITIRELAGMRSGLANYSALPAFQQALVADPTRSWTTSQLLEYAFAAPPNFEPGARYEYSNTNTVLLGQVIEAVTGQNWQSEVAKTITGPLELTTVVYPDNDPFSSPAATGYSNAGTPEAQPPVKTSLFGAAGGLVGTVGDLGRWARALGSGSLLTPALQREREATPSDTTDDPASPLYSAYGLGIGEIVVDGAPWWGHTGVGVGYESLAMHDVKDDATIAILINVTNKDQDVPARILPTLVKALDLHS
jgi:D-alanyl-D-alanine carboxypeptidase